mmetsp:Transcript_5120/g.10556  ORF Transcript_5120/g.10556 Transcript_5120/m.10556 type:complete len:205 (-) Transcript_5120:122-736(-)
MVWQWLVKTQNIALLGVGRASPADLADLTRASPDLGRIIRANLAHNKGMARVLHNRPYDRRASVPPNSLKEVEKAHREVATPSRLLREPRNQLNPIEVARPPVALAFNRLSNVMLQQLPTGPNEAQVNILHQPRSIVREAEGSPLGDLKEVVSSKVSIPIVQIHPSRAPQCHQDDQKEVANSIVTIRGTPANNHVHPLRAQLGR